MWKLRFSVLFVIFSVAWAEDSSALSSSSIVKFNSLNISTTLRPSDTEDGTDRKTIEDKSSVPRKGVGFLSEDNQSLNNVSSTIPLPAEEKKEPSKPRKGAILSGIDLGVEQIKEPSKPRKGAVPLVNETQDEKSIISITPIPIVKFKPTASGLDPSGDDIGDDPSSDFTALTVGLSLGVVLILILASVSYWRLRDVWSRRQYKRVDFLIDGMYVDA